MATRFYSTSDVAQMCNVHRNTIIAAIRQGKLRAFKTPGGHARIAHADLLSFCKERGLPISRQISRNDKVLIVDNDAAHARQVGQALEQLGYRVRIAEDIFEGGFLTAAFLPDILLLDLAVGDQVAERICRRIRRSKSTRSKVHILGLASKQGTTPNVLFEAGLDDVLQKPVETDRLKEHIVELCGSIDREIPIRDESQFELTSFNAVEAEAEAET